VINLVHDEIVVECPMEEGERIAELLERAMKRAGGIILKKVPVEVECVDKGEVGEGMSSFRALPLRSIQTQAL
jgi:DNA polymerase I-like protein with 3'-5' exonuclease and polymerase domains